MAGSGDSGLGELLRHLIELTDGSSDKWYKAQRFNFRPRYTPIMRALQEGSASVSDLQKRLAVTQGAISQTIKLMLEDGLIEKLRSGDGRQTIVVLTTEGKAVLTVLKPHWDAIFVAIAALEQEVDFPLLKALQRTVKALETQSFAKRIETAKTRAEPTTTDPDATSFFQADGARYLQYRPIYPEELAQALSSLCQTTELALDVGCGNGQLTQLLAPYFNGVVGTDPSASQLQQAQSADNIVYQQESAEAIALADNSVDLVVAAQAAHWFDLDAFYAEAQRVAKEGAVIALISYGVPYICGPVNAVFQKGYWQDVHHFWPDERKHVEEGYANLYFPFPALSLGNYDCKLTMGVDDFIHYIATWSAYSVAEQTGELASFTAFFAELKNTWPRQQTLDVVWPISIKAGALKPTGDFHD